MRWAVTFGQKYRHEDHPTFLPAHPDGYVVIDVPDTRVLQGEVAAREAAFELLGSQWAFMHTMSEIDAMQLDGTDLGAMFPRGQIGLIEQQHGHWVFVEPHAAYGFWGPEDGAPAQCWCKIRQPHHVDEQS